MCSNLEENIQPERRNVCQISTCMKCDQPAVVVLRNKDGYCRDCFMSYSIHKFRMSFGKSRLIRDQEKVVLALSGGNSSSAMLHLVQEGKSERAKRKLRFLPILVHIDESCVLGTDSTATNKQLLDKMAVTGHDFALYHLSQVFQNDVSPVVSKNNTHDGIEGMTSIEHLLERCTVNSEEDTSVQKLLSSAKTLTAKQNVLIHLRLQLLSKIAAYHECTKVLIGDTSTQLAIHMLSNITQGGGAHLSYQMGFADNRRDDVTFVRPMREFSNKEVAMYNALNKVEPVFLPNLSTKAPTNSSLYRLTEEFVTGLQADFPNTVSIIFRTGEKLDVTDKTDNKGGNCCMCQAPLDTDVGECSALGATLFSQLLSNTKKPQANPKDCNTTTTTNQGDYTNVESTSQGVCNKGESDNSCDCKSSGEGAASSTECCGQGDGSCQTISNRLSLEELHSALCYGCRLVVKDMDDHTTLPRYMLDAAAKHVRRTKMRDSIQEFLLVDEG